MTSRLAWRLSRLLRRIWFRSSLFSLLAVATALFAIVVEPYIPGDLRARIGADAVDNILGIIASSMLTVTTFSLSTMVSAYGAATSNVTPRATRLVMEDSTTQNVLATFIGSFLFSLVGIIALSAGAYGGSGRVVLFIVTIGVIVLITVTLLRWIDHLSRLGRVTETTARVEEAATRAMREWIDNPYLGGQSGVEIPVGARPVHDERIGYVQHLDIGALDRLAEKATGRIHVVALPGAFIAPNEPIAWFDGAGFADDCKDAIRACFTVEDVRSFDQDPRFGASVLAEIASRALSPAVNDPGTAIDVIGRAVRLLALWAESRSDASVDYERVHVPAVTIDDLLDDLFTPIARDGAALVEVGIRLQKALATLARLNSQALTAGAERHSRLALARAEAALMLEEDKVTLRGLHNALIAAAK